MAANGKPQAEYRALPQGYELRTETNGGPLTRPIRGAGKQLILLDNLARLEQSRQPLTNMIMRMVTDSRRAAHNILITPHVASRTFESVERQAMRATLNIVNYLNGEKDYIQANSF